MLGLGLNNNCWGNYRKIHGDCQDKKTGKLKSRSLQLSKDLLYFSSTFQRISLGLKQIVLLLIETAFINIILSKINLYIQ